MKKSRKTLKAKCDAIGRGIVRRAVNEDEDPTYNARTGIVEDSAGRVAKLYVSGARIRMTLYPLDMDFQSKSVRFVTDVADAVEKAKRFIEIHS